MAQREASRADHPEIHSGSMQVLVTRLRPGDDLRQHLERIAKERELDAAVILCCVGSLRKVGLRFADQEDTSIVEGKYEITSLTGTLSRFGSHLHLGLADAHGVALGGHLKDGCEVYTTAEIAIGVIPELAFSRRPDPTTGYEELAVEPATRFVPNPADGQDHD